MGMP